VTAVIFVCFILRVPRVQSGLSLFVTSLDRLAGGAMEVAQPSFDNILYSFDSFITLDK
jgi:hypothetical protein